MELSIANMHYNVYGNAYGIEVHTETPTLGVSSFLTWRFVATLVSPFWPVAVMTLSLFWTWTGESCYQ